MIDTLSLGGIVFDPFSSPEHIPFGGDHSVVVHKLPGGQRVIDTLGPDDMDIHWSGRFWGSDAMTRAQAIDAIRRAGLPVPLIFAGIMRMVIVTHFAAEIERYPNNVLYNIGCVQVTAGIGAGLSPALGSAALAAADIAAAALL